MKSKNTSGAIIDAQSYSASDEPLLSSVENKTSRDQERGYTDEELKASVNRLANLAAHQKTSMTPAQKRDANDIVLADAIIKAMSEMVEAIRAAEAAGLYVSAQFGGYSEKHGGVTVRREFKNASRHVKTFKVAL